jgi:hypothetical protein
MSKAQSAHTSAAAEKKPGAPSGDPANLRGFPGPIQPGATQIGPQGGLNPLPAVQLAGQFAIVTAVKRHFVTAVGGGGNTSDVLHTDALQPRAWEKFRLWFVPSTGEYGIQTVNGQFLSATNGGGLSGLFPLGDNEVDTIESTAEYIIDYERFKISTLAYDFFPTFGIQTVRGFYLTAIGGGDQTDPPVLHTDATTAKTWEQFALLKSDDPGSGNTFGIMVSGGGLGPADPGDWIVATNGGHENGNDGLQPVTIGVGNLDSVTLGWTIIRQSDGTYAFQTSSRYYLTANGGGAPGDYGPWRTDASQVGNWEKFTLTPNDDCTYYIQTYNGYYIGVAQDLKGNSYPQPFPEENQAIRWRLWVFDLAPNT